jgi:hypothetical protein
MCRGVFRFVLDDNRPLLERPFGVLDVLNVLLHRLKRGGLAGDAIERSMDSKSKEP